MNLNHADTIAAVATPIGQGGIGIVRVSGQQVPDIAKKILGQLPKPRYATFSLFQDVEGYLIDQGIALYFPAPHSFTGEAILELHGHGGYVVMDQLLKTTLYLGARLAHPGEFSQRAFLNGKIDLAQAEAIADLIESTSTQAARCALRSLQGAFSNKIEQLVEKLIELRSYIEAGIDFVDDEIDILADSRINDTLKLLSTTVEAILAQAQQGYLLKAGVNIALIGEPNVGKSSLLNQLAGRETAIVTPIAGTTRDVVREQIHLDGIPLHITDTAGLRDTADPIEQEGIRRTQQALKEADVVIVLLDERHHNDYLPALIADQLSYDPLIIRNKIDLSGHTAGMQTEQCCYLSAKTGAGLEAFKGCLKQKIGLRAPTEGEFIARRRHLDALQQAKHAFQTSLNYIDSRQSELLAEELRQAQQALTTITGAFSTDDLLARIFSTFCIGK
ncbi:MAG: tRNA uridine-5-carboxymethylaminomethyl(34) synthesis GTPase MnmE [Pseudomonadota bacterium]|nr:tRNA uridine-5-carboxymethylaminomethyl(34) synthesis GTPase MnmE [Pseudomonadota bacterium]